MSQQSTQRFMDLTLWYREHESTKKSIDNEVAFLKTANRNLLAMIAFLIDDIDALEGRRTLQLNRERLFTPTGSEIRGVQGRNGKLP